MMFVQWWNCPTTCISRHILSLNNHIIHKIVCYLAHFQSLTNLDTPEYTESAFSFSNLDTLQKYIVHATVYQPWTAEHSSKPSFIQSFTQGIHLPGEIFLYCTWRTVFPQNIKCIIIHEIYTKNCFLELRSSLGKESNSRARKRMGEILANLYPEQPATEIRQDTPRSPSAPTPKGQTWNSQITPFPNFNWHEAFLTSDRYLRISVSYGNVLYPDLEALTGKTMWLK